MTSSDCGKDRRIVAARSDLKFFVFQNKTSTRNTAELNLGQDWEQHSEKKEREETVVLHSEQMETGETVVSRSEEGDDEKEETDETVVSHSEEEEEEDEEDTDDTVVLKVGSDNSDKSSSLEESDSEGESLVGNSAPSEVFDLVQTISKSQLPEDDTSDAMNLFRKLLNNKNVVVEKKSSKEYLVTDEEGKWSIIRTLLKAAKEEKARGGKRVNTRESFSLSYLTLKSFASMMAKVPKKSDNVMVFCKECNLFMKSSSFGGHNRFVHKKIRKFLCQTCGYATHTGSILRQHIQAVHVGYIFECRKCFQKFNLKKRLQKHEETCQLEKDPASVPDRKYICHCCGLAFSRMSYLKIHMLTHTNETPHRCQYCDRRFKFRWAKVQHERLHTGVKPYKCEYCEECFTQNILRKTHELKVHGRIDLESMENVPETEFGTQI